MATVAQSLALHDGFSPILKTIQSQMVKTIEIFDQMENRLNGSMNIKMGVSLDEGDFQNVAKQLSYLDRQVAAQAMPQVGQPISTQSTTRMLQENEILNNSLRILTENQKKVATTSRNLEVLSPKAFNRVEGTTNAMNALIQKINVAASKQVELNGVMSKTDASKASTSLDQVNRTIVKAYTAQHKLNDAMQKGNMKEINRQGKQLETIIKKATGETNKLTDRQNKYNQSLNKGNNTIGRMAKGLFSMAGAYGLLRAGKGLFSDALGLDKMERTLGARLGDMDVGSALFEKLKEKAKTSAFSLEDLVGNTNSFMAMTTDMKQLDGLNAIAEKLAIFDTTGQGLAGAGFSIKEALSGDIVSLADRFNMSKSLIRGLGIDKLGKAGDIEGFIEQFNKLLDMQNMGDEAYAEILKAPETQLNMLKSNFKTAFSEAGLMAIGALQPLIEKLNSFMEGEGFNVFLGNLSMGLMYFVEGVTWAWDALNNLYGILQPFTPLIFGLVAAFLAYKGVMLAATIVQGIYSIGMALHTAFTKAQELGTYKAALAQGTLNTALLACPLTWIVIAIVAVVAAIIYLWRTNDQFAAALMRAWNWILNGLDQMVVGFMMGFYGILNFIGDFKTTGLGILETFINGAISMINGFISMLNNIPGVSIEVIEKVSLATESALKEEALAQKREIQIEDMKMKAQEKSAIREQNVLDMLQKREDKRNNPNKQDKPDWEKTLDGFEGKQTAFPDDVDVKKVKEPVKVLNDSFEYLRDFAEQNIFKDLQRLSADMHITYDKKVQEEGEMFIAKNDADLMRQNAKSETVINEYYLEYKSNVNNTVHKSQDIDEIYDLLEERTQEEIETSASFLVGEG